MADEEPLHIVVAESYGESALRRLREVGTVTILDACSEASLVQAVAACDALLVRSYARVTADVIGAANRLRVIGRGGVGLDNIDLPAARQRGITVLHTPDAATDAVADLTLGLMIGLLRDLRAADEGVRGGRFTAARQSLVGRDMSELTVGIIGLGRIGQAVARRCRQGFRCRILYNDIRDLGWLDFTATAVEKDALFAESDFVTLHVPLTEDTYHLINAQSLGLFTRGAFLVNTARGEVVESEALIAALHGGHLGGAALDVYEREPVPGGDPLLTAPNTLLTPHIGARTRQGLDRMQAVVDDVVRVLRGKPPRHPAVM